MNLMQPYSCQLLPVIVLLTIGYGVGLMMGWRLHKKYLRNNLRK